MDDIDPTPQGEHSPAPEGEGSPIERRLVMRLLRIWRDKADPDDMPPRERLTVEDVGRTRSRSAGRPRSVPDGREARLDWLGDSYAIDKAASLIGQPLTTAPEGTLIARASAYAGNVVTWRVPMSFGGELKHRHGQTLLFRSIILPLRGRDSGNDVGHLLGAANYRVLTP